MPKSSTVLAHSGLSLYSDAFLFLPYLRVVWPGWQHSSTGGRGWLLFRDPLRSFLECLVFIVSKVAGSLASLVSSVVDRGRAAIHEEEMLAGLRKILSLEILLHRC